MFGFSHHKDKKLGITGHTDLVKEEDKSKDSSDEEMEENYLKEGDLKEGDNLLGFELDNLFEGRKLKMSPTKVNLLDPMEKQPGLGQKRDSEKIGIEDKTEESRKEKVQDLLQQLSQYAKDQNILELIGSQQFSKDQKKVIQSFNKRKRSQSIDSASSENLSRRSIVDIHSLSPAREDKDFRPSSRKIYKKEGSIDRSSSSAKDEGRRSTRLQRSRERSGLKKMKHSSSSSSSSRASPVKVPKQVQGKKIAQKYPESEDENIELTNKANKDSPDSAAQDALLKSRSQMQEKELSLAHSVKSNALSAPKEPEAQASKAQDYLATFEMFRFKGKETSFFTPGADQESEEEEEEDEKEETPQVRNDQLEESKILPKIPVAAPEGVKRPVGPPPRFLPSVGVKPPPGTKVPVGPPPGIIGPPPGVIRPPPGGFRPPTKTVVSVRPPSSSVVPVGPPGGPPQITKPQSITAQIAKVSDFTGLCAEMRFTIVSKDTKMVTLKAKFPPFKTIEIDSKTFSKEVLAMTRTPVQTGTKEVQTDTPIEETPTSVENTTTEKEEAKSSAKKFEFDGIDMEGMDDMLMGDLEDSDEMLDEAHDLVPAQSSEIKIDNTAKLTVTNAVSTNVHLKGNNIEFDELVDDFSYFRDSSDINLKKVQSNLITKEALKLESQESLDQLGSHGKGEMILKLIKERESYREKLRIAQRAIQVRDTHIEKMKSEGKIIPLDMTNSRLHLAFMYSSPLIREINGKTENIMQLDYLTEIQDIVKVCSKMEYEMKYKEEVATVSNMRSIITDGPIALHFSGHGIENTYDNIGSDFYINEDKGNILLLEDEQGKSYYLFEKDLTTMIQEANTDLEVVFVSSCHSQFAGKVFLNAGAKHVICIQQGEKISDRASLRFSKVFYETLFVKHYNVCTSFRIAKEEIDKVINSTEANKFMLLTQDDDQIKSSAAEQDMYGFASSKKRHKCNALTNFKTGCLTNMNEIPVFTSNPSNVEGFIGRQKEMYEIIKHLNNHRLVSILGPPGIGKTSLARNLANYIKDRRKFSDGIIYLPLRGCESSQMFLTRLSLIIRTVCSLEDIQRYGLEDIDKSKNKKNGKEEGVEEEEDNEGKYRNFISNILRDKEALLILDNAEDPLEYDNTKFISEIQSILDSCPKLNFLLTTRKTLNSLPYGHEKPYILCPLTKEASLKLLISKAPRNINPQEIHQLLRCKIPKDCKIRQTLNVSSSIDRNSPKTLLDHPFTLLLGGHPQAISLAAPLLEYKSLKELFLDFCRSNMMDALEISTDNQNSSTSLRVSLELSINHMKNTNPKALNFFGFIGQFPGGIGEFQITQMWGDNSWIPFKDALIRASLLVYKTDANGKFIYNMLPFMTIRAGELLDEDDKLRYEFHQKSCKLYKDYCIEIYNSDKSLDTIEKLTDMETNIWACIYRSLNRRRDIEYVSTQDPELKADENPTDEEIIVTQTKIEHADWSIDPMGNPLLPKEIPTRGMKPVSQFDSSATTIENTSERKILNSMISLPQNHENVDMKNNQYLDEELMVLYYITDLITISKDGDAMKALQEYSNKEGISTLCLANLYKAHAVLCIISKEYKDISLSLSSIKMASKLFNEIGLKKGVGSCKFFISSLLYHDHWSELKGEKSEEEMLESSLHFCQSSLKTFKQVNWATGQLHAGKHEDNLVKKLRKKVNHYKSSRYYIDLSKKSKNEITLKECSWLPSKHLLFLNLIFKNETDSLMIPSKSSDSSIGNKSFKKTTVKETKEKKEKVSMPKPMTSKSRKSKPLITDLGKPNVKGISSEAQQQQAILDEIKRENKKKKAVTQTASKRSAKVPCGAKNFTGNK
ncbi:unnamed protein product [Moneuplotes crassus]|uniref:AAA+ ATPase domain-containing protein n=3 Tax=Euplotes crassus TaxID=5936 RepID=A0AAD1Y0B1_EUPCR|nr:unnamed protein product [Moneuplotes crassus]